MARSSITRNPNERIAWLGTIKFFANDVQVVTVSSVILIALITKQKVHFTSTTSTCVTEMMPRTTTKQEHINTFHKKYKRRCKDFSEEAFAT